LIVLLRQKVSIWRHVDGTFERERKLFEIMENNSENPLNKNKTKERAEFVSLELHFYGFYITKHIKVL
jgi:hypothetical protein